jgi:hypothetical protein
MATCFHVLPETARLIAVLSTPYSLPNCRWGTPRMALARISTTTASFNRACLFLLPCNRKVLFKPVAYA